MKNKSGLFALTGVLAVTAAFSFTAFADESEKLLIAPNPGGSSIVQDGAASMDLVDGQQQAVLPSFVTTSGKIESIQDNENGKTISITNDDMGMVFHVEEGITIISRKDNSYLQLSDLKEGMEITGIVRGNAPQTMSLPPQTSGAVALVVNDGEGFLSAGRFNGDFVNEADRLQLNIGDDTVIVDQKGTKKVFTAEDIKNQDLLVFYTVTTRSIPAQTTPSFVMILDAPAVITETEPAAEITAAAEVAPATENEPSQLNIEEVALRKTAEEAGFTVTWTANDQPVLLEKDGVTISITVGKQVYTKNGQEQNTAIAPSLKDGQIFIATDVADSL